MRKLLLGLSISATLLCASMAANAADARTCLLRGEKSSCPAYVTIVPSKATDGSVVVPPNVSTTLFGGITPPNGFIVEVLSTGPGETCWVNDKWGGRVPDRVPYWKRRSIICFRHAVRLQTDGAREYFL
jgi:hypothetical protein